MSPIKLTLSLLILLVAFATISCASQTSEDTLSFLDVIGNAFSGIITPSPAVQSPQVSSSTTEPLAQSVTQSTEEEILAAVASLKPYNEVQSASNEETLEIDSDAPRRVVEQYVQSYERPAVQETVVASVEVTPNSGETLVASVEVTPDSTVLDSSYVATLAAAYADDDDEELLVKTTPVVNVASTLDTSQNRRVVIVNPDTVLDRSGLDVEYEQEDFVEVHAAETLSRDSALNMGELLTLLKTLQDKTETLDSAETQNFEEVRAILAAYQQAQKA